MQSSEVRAATTTTPLRKAVAYFTFNAHGNTGDGGADADRRFRSYCERAGYAAARTFITNDDGKTDAYWSLLNYLRNVIEEVTVVVPDLQSLGEKPDDVTVSILELEHLGARIQVLDGDSIDGVSLVTSGWGKDESGQDLRDRIRAAMRRRAIKGEGLGKPPYGYRIGANRKLEVLDQEAKTVRLIYSIYTQRDLGIRLIVRHLNENEIRTRKDRNWSMVTIRDILRNRAYLGTYTRFGMRVPGSHPAIITPDMFRWAQSKLDSRKPNRTKSKAEPFLLSGMIYCGYCGNRMVGVTRKQSWIRRKDGSRAEKQYRYYQCQSRTNQSMCHYHTRRSQELETEVRDHLVAQRSRIATLKGRRGSGGQQAQRGRERLEEARKNTDRKLRKATDQLFRRQTTVEAFRASTQPLLQARTALLDQLVALTKANENEESGLTAGQQAAQVIDRLSARWNESELLDKRNDLHRLLDKVVVFDDHFDVKLQLG